MSMTTEERLERIERLLIISAKEALTVAEVALFMGVSESRVRHLTCERAMPYYKQGTKTFFKKSEIEKWMLSDRVDTASESEEKAATYVQLNKSNLRWKTKS